VPVTLLELAEASQQVLPARARPASPSSSTTSITASAAAAGIGSETCEVTCTKPRAWHSSSIAALVATALIGTPPPSVLDSTSRSGTTS
jgi:hypothetical protein